MVTSSETIVGTKIFLGNFKLLCTRHVGTRLYRSFSIVWGGHRRYGLELGLLRLCRVGRNAIGKKPLLDMVFYF